MEVENLLININNGIAIVMINRPSVRNAIDLQTQQELVYLLGELVENNDVQVVIITGVGEKVFASGADIGDLKKRTMLEALQGRMQALTSLIENFNKPIIAAINGYALGGGCELAMACDIRIAANHAKFGLPEVGLGVLPGAGGTQRMTELVGKGKAKELIFTGKIIKAEEAERIGLINDVVPYQELLQTAKEMAYKIMKKGPIALRLAKLAINAASEGNLKTGLEIEKLSQAILMTTEDKVEGTSAFLEKRTPNYKGR